jgi:hypothetical protein
MHTGVIMTFNLVSASAATGVNRSTVLRAIKGGRLSAQRDEQGAWTIEPVELFRVFPPLPAAAPPPAAQQVDGQVAQLNNMIALLQKVADDARLERDHWREAFQAMQRLLPAPTQPDAQPRNRLARAWRALHGAA